MELSLMNKHITHSACVLSLQRLHCIVSRCFHRLHTQPA